MSFEESRDSAEKQIVIESNSPEETGAIGRELGRQAGDILTEEEGGRSKAGGEAGALVVLLEGELGSGKTCLVRGAVTRLIPGSRVTSPTYTFLNDYHSAGITIYHADLYRLNSAEELNYLGLYDLLAENCLLLVEWPELFPRSSVDYLNIRFERSGELSRRLILRAVGDRSIRLLKGLRGYEDAGH